MIITKVRIKRPLYDWNNSIDHIISLKVIFEMDRSFKFTEKKVLLSGKKLWFHNFSSQTLSEWISDWMWNAIFWSLRRSAM